MALAVVVAAGAVVALTNLYNIKLLSLESRLL